jgi:hypothetical protein
MNKQFVERLFAEIDSNADKLEKLTKLVYEMAGAVSILKKLILALIISTLVSYSGLVYKHVTKSSTSKIQNKGSVKYNKKLFRDNDISISTIKSEDMNITDPSQRVLNPILTNIKVLNK